MWRHTKMVVLVALNSAIYAAVLIPFKGFPVITGYIEIRPANVIPVVFGLLFGPAAAWGSAIGNLIGDFFGTLTLGSISGLVGNFFLGLLPYKMWSAFFRSDENMETTLESGKKFGLYSAVVIVASVVCALIVFNNALMTGVLGPILLLALYPRVRQWGLLWTEIMEPQEASASRFQRTGAILVWIGGLGGALAGLFLGLGAQAPQNLGVGLAVIPFLILIFVGSFMLGGREQVEAMEGTIDARADESKT